MMGSAQRFSIPAIVGDLLKTNVDLDTGAEVDIISVSLAKQCRFELAKKTAPILEAVGNFRVPTYGVYTVPITLTDSRGTTRTVERPCIAVDRDPDLKGSPVLLSMTSLVEMKIYLIPNGQKWWFEAPSMELCSPHRFAKKARNHAFVYAVICLPEEIPAKVMEAKVKQDSEKGTETPRIPTELQDYSDVFSAEGSKYLFPHGSSDHAIELKDGTDPPYGPIYPLSQNELRVLREYLEENIKLGRIRYSQSSAGAPILFVPKKDGGLRLCVDYRGLNRVSVKNRYPLPLISEILDRVAGAKYFSKIDVQDAYYRIRIKEGDEWKTAFRTRYGHFEYTVMPFGLTNAPATFQHYIHDTLRGLLDIFCVAYLDDVLIFSSSRDEHTGHLKEVLQRLRNAQLFAKLSKCSFYQHEVEFLGYIISQKGISMDTSRVSAIVSWPEPKSFHDIQVFIGFCNFYRRFIQRFSLIAQPLTSLLKGSKDGRKPGKLELAGPEKEAFRTLIDAFRSAPLLRHFDPELPIRIETDASVVGMAGIMSQPDKQGVWHPIAFWSRKFTETETRYGTPDQELFAIVHSFKHWRQYLDGAWHTIEVLSDHANLQAFMRQEKINGRQARWCMSLIPFDFTIKHRAGKTNPADAPSRLFEGHGDARGSDILGPLRDRLGEGPLVGREPVLGQPVLCGRLAVTGSGLSPTSFADPIPDRGRSLDVMDLINPKSQFGAAGRRSWGAPPPRCDALKDCTSKSADWAVCEDLMSNQRVSQVIVNALISRERDVHEMRDVRESADILAEIRRIQDGDPETQRRILSIREGATGSFDMSTEGLVLFRGRFYIPPAEELKQALLRIYHDHPLGGHFGVHRTTELLKQHFHWTGLDDYVKDYIAHCGICQGTAIPRHRPYGKLESLPIPSRPFTELTMDFITGLPQTIFHDKTVDAILVIVDRFTKICLFFPVSTRMTADELAELFHNEVELRFGPPAGIVSDRGSIFTSKFWAKLCQLTQIKLRLSTAFHPQTDGQTERTNQVLEHYLRCFIDKEQVMWPKLLRSAQFACNRARSATTGVSPFKALMGFNPDFVIRAEAGTETGGVPEANARIEKLHELREGLTEHWRKVAESHKKQYNRKHQEKHFEKGSLIALSTKNLKLKIPSRKLAPRFIGPFRVLDRVGQQAYRIGLPAKYSRIHNVFHVSLLESWQTRDRNGPNTVTMPELEDDDEWEVEEVKDEKEIEGELHFLLKWKGWPSEYNQWVPANNINAPTLIRKFKNNRRRQ